MNTIDANRRTNPLTSSVKMNHYVYVDGRMNPLNNGEKDYFPTDFLHIAISCKQMEDDVILTKITFQNEKNGSVPVKLIVENDLYRSKNHYGFISPTKDVLFLANEDRLFLTSGIFKDRFFSQYGVVKKDRNIKSFIDGHIPFSPIAGGEVVGMYSFEQKLAPLERVTAYTWILTSTTKSETELLRKDKQLKQTLAFSDKR